MYTLKEQMQLQKGCLQQQLTRSTALYGCVSRVFTVDKQQQKTDWKSTVCHVFPALCSLFFQERLL